MISQTKILFVIITNTCNSKCIHCTYWENKKSIFINIDILMKSVLYLKKKGLETVFLTGGEPILHPEFNKIIIFLKKNNLKIKIATNGILLNKISEKVLSSIDEITISLDSFEKNTYYVIRGVDKFEIVLNNIQQLIKLNKNVKVSFLIQKKNYRYISSFIYFCNKIMIKNVSFLVPNNQGDFNSNNLDIYKDMLLSTQDLKNFKNCLPEIKDTLCKTKINSNYTISNFNKIIEYFENFNKNSKHKKLRSKKCPIPLNSLVLTENGKIKPCLFLPFEFENYLIKEISTTEINYFINDYIFKPELSTKYCSLCLEVPLDKN